MNATGAGAMTVEKEIPMEESPSAPRKSASAFRTISEVADELGVQQHVLRFWETKFSQIKPLKRGGGRRYYRPEDVLMLQRVHDLLYNEGYTIKGVQKLLKGQGRQQIAQQQQEQEKITLPTSPPVASGAEAAVTTPSVQTERTSGEEVPQQRQPDSGLTPRQRTLLQEMLDELREMREMVRAEKAS